MEFKELKQELLDRAKAKGACEDGYSTALCAESKAELLEVITSYWRWVFVEKQIIDACFLEDNFTREELSGAGICTAGTHIKKGGRIYALNSAKVNSLNGAAVKAYESSTVGAHDSATVEAYDNAYVINRTKKIIYPNDKAIVRDYYSNRIYVKKGAFEIIEVE